MKASYGLGQSTLTGFVKSVKRHQLAFACVVIAICFALGNDIYRAKAIVLKNKDLFPGKKQVVNYLDATKRGSINALLRSDLRPRYLVNPNIATQGTMIKAFAGGNTCLTPTLITNGSYSDPAGTTINKLDDYKLTSSASSACPSCTGITFGPNNTAGRGNVYQGTGTGADAAYRIVTGGTGSMTINMKPQTGVNLALILYGATCSSASTDVIAVSDFGYSGEAEKIVVGSMPAGTYHIVVDGYAYSGQPAQQGTYSLTVTSSAVPTAAGVTVAGRVATARGAGLVNAQVSLTDQNGVARYVRTGASGAYQFDDVETGHTYIITVYSRRYQFDNPSTVISLTDAISDLNFTATPRRLQ